VQPGEAAELALAGHDLRQLASDIAAADVSPSNLRRRRARRGAGGDDRADDQDQMGDDTDDDGAAGAERGDRR
jgi:hypothetical protein